MIEAQLLSKVIDENSFYLLGKYNVVEADFEAYSHVYRYVKEYVAEYHQTPDYRNVVAKFGDFDYYPDVHDSFAYLCKTLKGMTAKRKAFELLQLKATENYKAMNGTNFAEWLSTEAQKLEAIAKASSSSGSNYAVNGAERKQRYVDNKENRTNIFIPTPYPSLTKYLDNGLELSDYILLQAFSNSGKTWVASHFGYTAWKAKFDVLHYSPELSRHQQENRLDTVAGHFNNVALRNSQLDNEEAYFNFLDGFGEKNETAYIIKCMEDLPDGLTTEVIEADLQANPNIKFVIIDGFNLMKHKGGDSMRNSMSLTSRNLRQIFARYTVAGLVVHQVSAQSEKDKKKGEDEAELPKVPDMLSFSETSAVIQDACTILGLDCVGALGVIGIAKCRGTGKGKEVDLRVNYNEGYIQEASPVDYFMMGEKTG